MLLTNTTELEAVNELLLTIDESPVNTLSGLSGLTDASVAVDVLRSVCRSVQSAGWFFNQDKDYPITLNGSSEAVIPSGVLKIKPSAQESRTLVPRNGKLYDMTERTYVLTAEPTVDIVWFFDFETLPETARNFITISAARKFQSRVQGSEAIHKFTERDEQVAMIELQYEENRFAKANTLSGSSDVSEIWVR